MAPVASPDISDTSSIDYAIRRKSSIRDFESERARDWYRRLAELDIEATKECYQKFEDLGKLEQHIKLEENSLLKQSIGLVREAENSGKNERTEHTAARQDLAGRIERMEGLIHQCLKLARRVDEENCQSSERAGMEHHSTGTPPPSPTDNQQAVPIQTKPKPRRPTPFRPRPKSPCEAGPSKPPVYRRQVRRTDSDEFSEFVCKWYAEKEQDNKKSEQPRKNGIWIN
jgi:hypothetical protein